MRPLHTVLLGLTLAVLAVPAQAQTQEEDLIIGAKLFRDRDYYEPLLAEPRPARIMLLIPAWSKEFPHSVNSGSRFAWQISLGEELPIVTVSNQEKDGLLEPGRWGLGLWIPISFHVIEDFKDTSNPIVDTDYRFGFMLKFQRAFGKQPSATDDNPKKYRLGVRFVPWNHESTHLGDEYTILASRDPGFERINVSYENWEYGVSIEGGPLFGVEDSWKLRTGGRKPWGKDGYYSDHLLGSEEKTLTPSIANFEPSIGVEYRFDKWRNSNRHVYVSADVRLQTVYNYHQTPENPEERQWSLNWQLGRTVPEGTKGLPLKQYFVQVYRGVNPYGQLRSQKDYWSVGLGFVFGL
jgi:hypothetical protein